MNVLEKIEAWHRNGRELAEEIEAERDTITRRIEQDRLYVMDLNERLRDLRDTLGQDAREASPVDARRRIVMTRSEQQAVPVIPARPISKITKFDAVREALSAGPATAVEVAKRVQSAGVDIKTAVVSVYLKTLKDRGDVVSEPISPGNKAHMWSLKAA